jgi:DNA gyrase subunit A
VRTPVADVSIVGRNTQGVRLIRLDEGERLAGVESLDALAADELPASGVGPANELVEEK